jgi:hypothetical protein
MPKQIKGLAGRRPPTAHSDHSEISTWIAGQMPAVQPLVARLDELVCAGLRSPRFAVKWAKAYYGVEGLGWVIELAAYHKSVNVVFFAGAEFTPPPPLGETDRTRYVKLTGLADADDPQLRAWIHQATTAPGWPWE